MAVNERAAALLLVAAAAGALYVSTTPAPTLNGKALVPTKVDLHLLRKTDEVDGELAVKYLPTGDELLADVYNGHVYWKAEGDDTAKRWSVRYHLERDVVDVGWDFGTFAGLADRALGDDRDVDIGVRVSPARLLFGAVAPDALIAPHDAGFGLSVYPAPEYFGRGWRHVGVGLGHVWPYDGDSSRNVAYLSFATRF